MPGEHDRALRMACLLDKDEEQSIAEEALKLASLAAGRFLSRTCRVHSSRQPESEGFSE